LLQRIFALLPKYGTWLMHGIFHQVAAREPRDFRDYARRTAATGVWNASAAA
jgi:hypothetical protein